jgi:hypothetical protein
MKPDLETQMAEVQDDTREWIERIPFWAQGLVMLGVGVGVALFTSGLIWLTIRRW